MKLKNLILLTKCNTSELTVAAFKSIIFLLNVTHLAILFIFY